MLSRALPRVAAASLLALSLAACSGGDDNDDKDAKSPEQKAWEAQVDPDFVVGTREKPESVGGCKTEVTVVDRHDTDGEADVAVYPAAVLRDGALTLWASDEELDLGKLPASPRKDDDDTFVTVQIDPVGKGKKAKQLSQGERIEIGKKKSAFTVDVTVADNDAAPAGPGAGKLTLIELGSKTGEGVCARFRFDNDAVSVSGTIFATLVVSK